MKNKPHTTTEDILKEFESDLDVVDGLVHEAGHSGFVIDSLKMKIRQALSRKDEEWKEKVLGLKMERMVCKECGNGEFQWNYDSPDCTKCQSMGPDFDVIGFNIAVDEFNTKIDDLLE